MENSLAIDRLRKRSSDLRPLVLFSTAEWRNFPSLYPSWNKSRSVLLLFWGERVRSGKRTSAPIFNYQIDANNYLRCTNSSWRSLFNCFSLATLYMMLVHCVCWVKAFCSMFTFVGGRVDTKEHGYVLLPTCWSRKNGGWKMSHRPAIIIRWFYIVTRLSEAMMKDSRGFTKSELAGGFDSALDAITAPK